MNNRYRIRQRRGRLSGAIRLAFFIGLIAATPASADPYRSVGPGIELSPADHSDARIAAGSRLRHGLAAPSSLHGTPAFGSVTCTPTRYGDRAPGIDHRDMVFGGKGGGTITGRDSHACLRDLALYRSFPGEDGGISDLDTPVSPDADWILTGATTGRNSGGIVGTGLLNGEVQGLPHARDLRHRLPAPVKM